MMKLISWNVNGLRACEGKGFSDIFRQLDADFFCLQETKMQEGQLDLRFEGYKSYWNYAEKKGYSGTAIFTKHEPLSVEYGIGIDVHDHEGRVITLEMEQFYLVCCYTPNSQDGLKRLEYRMSWEDAFRNYLKRLDKKKPVILCGDLNVAHQEIDLKNPKTNRMNAVLVVVVPLPGSSEECRVAHRLFRNQRKTAHQHCRCADTDRRIRQRPLSRNAGIEYLTSAPTPLPAERGWGWVLFLWYLYRQVATMSKDVGRHNLHAIAMERVEDVLVQF